MSLSVVRPVQIPELAPLWVRVPTTGPVEPAAAWRTLAAVPVMPVEIRTEVSDLLPGLRTESATPVAVLVLELAGTTSELDMMLVKNSG